MRGKAYRRRVKKKNHDRLLSIITGNRYISQAGYLHYGYVDGEWKPIENHILYPKNSNIQKFLKRQSRRKVRRSDQLFQGNSYRKHMEYKWELY